MQLFEQVYNSDREYFHSSPSKIEAFKGDTYLTPDYAYVVGYSLGSGYIYKCKLKNANLFDFRDADDAAKFRGADLPWDIDQVDALIERLKTDEWKDIEFSHGEVPKTTRGELIKIVKSLKYDGFFNYEHCDKVDRSDNGMAEAICVFKPELIEIVGCKSVKGSKKSEWYDPSNEKMFSSIFRKYY